MSAGPSPVRPLIMLGTLALFLYGSDLMKLLLLVTEREDATVALLFMFPIILLLTVHFTSELIVIPLVLLVVIFLLKNILIGLLILLLAIQFLGKHYSSSSGKMVSNQAQGSDDRGEGVGLGCFILVLLFFILYSLFYEGEGYGYGWVSLILALTFVAFFNMFQ